MRRTLGVLLLSVSLLACGGDGGGSGTEDAGVGAVDGSGGADGGGGGGGGGTLFPLAAGLSWTYDITTTGISPCAGGTHTMSVLGPTTAGGRDGWEVRSFCASAGTSVMAADGDEVSVFFSGEWIVTLGAPVAAGISWSSIFTSYVWRDAGTVTVPAGTFSDCWTAEQQVAYTADTTYCRGVGMVRSVSVDLAGGGWDAVLTARAP